MGMEKSQANREAHSLKRQRISGQTQGLSQGLTSQATLRVVGIQKGTEARPAGWHGVIYNSYK